MPGPEHPLVRLPSYSETLSFRKRPCRFEPPTQIPHESDLNPLRRQCPYLDYCHATTGALNKLEKLVYIEGIRVTLCEPSSSPVVRSEHQYNRQERRRLSLRKHLYTCDKSRPAPFALTKGVREAIRVHLSRPEREASAQPVSEVLQRLEAIPTTKIYDSKDKFINDLSAAIGPQQRCDDLSIIVREASTEVGCTAFHSDEPLRDYVGFIDVRPNSITSPIGMACLAPPPRYQHEPQLSFVLGSYGKLFGGPSFPCTVYSMHDSQTGGAYCAQACLVMMLSMLADRGAVIKGTYTLTYRGKPKTPVQGTSSRPGCIIETVDLSRTPLKTFHIDGLTLPEMAGLLRTCNATAETTPIPNQWPRELVGRIVEAYILARYPVILPVRTTKWWPWDKQGSGGHAVVIVGVRRSTETGKLLSFLTHDPGYIPFYERPFDACLDAHREVFRSNHYWLLFAGDEELTRHLTPCLHALARSPDGYEFFHYYAAPDRTAYDYSIRLVPQASVAETIIRLSSLLQGSSPDPQDMARLSRTFHVHLVPGRYWCITGTHRGVPKTHWLFNVSDRAQPEITPWRVDHLGDRLELVNPDGTNVAIEYMVRQ